MVALVAVGLAIGSWFRPLPSEQAPSTPPVPTYTDQRTADAKAYVCAAFAKLDRAVSVGDALPRGSDPLVAAINSRQMFDVFSRHLLTTLSEEPATPPDLATADSQGARVPLRQVVIADQDGFSNSDPELRPVVDANSAAAETIRQLCK